MQASFATTDELIDLLRFILEDISLRFDKWENQYVRGPSLYFVLTGGVQFGAYADPLGDNQWPTDIAEVITRDLSPVIAAAEDIAFDADGAVMVTADGTLQRRMVRIRPSDGVDIRALEYPDWMSAKHLSALEVSANDEVIAAVTLSEENGRVTVFEDGTFDDYERSELGGRWRIE
jgi:hypothetical protein